MAGRAAPRSLAGYTLATVRTDILAGRYAPGARLSPRLLGADLGVSLSVVREALTRLAEQGLVVAEPQLGFSVVGLDLDDVRDISRVRVLIEGAALHDAVGHADVEYEARVLASHHRLTRTPLAAEGSGMTDEWALAHAHFHRALLSASTSGRLRDLAASLRETAELYRRWSGVTGSPVRRDVGGEHRALTAAVLDRDADRAVGLLTEHINSTARMLEVFVEQGPYAVPPPAQGDRGAPVSRPAAAAAATRSP